MNKRAQLAVSIVAMAAGFSALIALSGGGGATSLTTRRLLSIVQPLVHSFGSNGAIVLLIVLGIVTAALIWFWPASGGSPEREAVLSRAPSKADALAGRLPLEEMPTSRRRFGANLVGAESEASGAVRASVAADPSGDDLMRGIAAAAQAELDRLDAMADARMNLGPPEPGIGEARSRPIVFAGHVRPKDGQWLCYYGGRPTVPPGFVWPMSAHNPARPIHFLVQWDCAQLAAEDATGLLPRDGVLYCFLDCPHASSGEKSPLDARFIHLPGPAAGWRALEPPPSLGPVYGADEFPYCSWRAEAGKSDLPSLRPRWTFQPVAIDYPPPDPDADPDDGEEQGFFWSEYSGVAEELLKAQARTVGLPGEDERRPGGTVERPFAGFPHDWAAVRVLAQETLRGLSGSSIMIDGVLPAAHGDTEAKRQLIARWGDEANELFAFAARHELNSAVPQAMADDIWGWCESVTPALRLGFDDAVKDTVNASLGLGSAALGAIPAEWIDRVAARHALARGVPGHADAKCPNRIFGPPSYVQGYVDEFILDHVLLLEMSSSEGIDFHLGDGVLQFLIKPEDLREGRFDKVMVISTGY